jgi:hypothetical protein
MAKGSGKRGRTTPKETRSKAASSRQSEAADPKKDFWSRLGLERPESLRDGLQRVRNRAPAALEALREKATERLEQMPEPVKNAVQASERALARAFEPVRAFCQNLLKAAQERVAALRRTA